MEKNGHPKIHSYTSANKGVHFFYQKFIEPKSVDEDHRRHEFILNIILVCFIILLIVLNLLLLYNFIHLGNSFKGAHPAIFSIIVAFFMALLFVSRKGYFRPASYLLVAAFFLVIFYAEYKWGVDLPLALLANAILVVVSSILISSRFGFLIALLIALSIIPLGYYQSRQAVIPPGHCKLKPIDKIDSIEASVMLFLILIVSWLSNREIESSLNRARKSESELKNQKDVLETEVEKRTAELKKVQFEKISQLYRFAEMGRLSAGLFHDLMNPLTAVALNFERLKSIGQKQALDEVQGYLSQAIASAKQLEKFIIAVKKQMKHEESKQFFSLNTEIEQVLQILQYKTKRANVNIFFEPKEEIQIYENPLKFHQVAANLISNAIDSYDQSIEQPPVARIHKNVEVLISKSGDLIRFDVHDNGQGISKENVARIFEPFFTTKSNGLGVGLSTTKNIVENYFGGSITVQSQIDTGTSFIVEFRAVER